MKKIIYLLLGLVAMVYLVGCEEDPVNEEDPNEKIEEQNKKVNSWIWEEMDLYYLWRRFLPEQETSIKAPADYLSSILYISKDRWSYLTENYKDLVNSFKGIDKGAGYSLALWLVDKNIIGIVEFVYPNSPAERAGIQRGDIISKVNGKVLTVDNYYELLYETDNQVLGFSILQNNEVMDLERTETVVAEIISENPVLADTVYVVGDKKIGYLMYVGYISEFNYELDRVFGDFKAQGITDLVLDLRYNPGGNIDAANYLCSSIAPLDVVQSNSRLVNFNWNTDLQEYIQSQGWYESLYVNMIDTTVVNLDMSKVYILTTGGTASASELTITGLDPYMEVVTIGETTHGKYTASITLPDEDSLWALQPIVIQYSNSLGVTDFEDGFRPDYNVQDNFKWDIANSNDPMISKAIDVIKREDQVSAVVESEIVRKSEVITSVGEAFYKGKNYNLDVTDFVKEKTSLPLFEKGFSLQQTQK